MILYHGTNTPFEDIDLSRSKPNKDFGRGFYLSANKEQAMEMAVAKVDQLETGNPIVMDYEVDETSMSTLKVLRFDSYSEEWAKFILLNRNNASNIPAHYYDIVVGSIANDRVAIMAVNNPPIPLKANLANQICGVNIFCLIGL